MDLRRILGNLLIGLGAANILNFWAPIPIPTVGVPALVLGTIFMVGGIMLRRKAGSGSGSSNSSIEWGRLEKLLKGGRRTSQSSTRVAHGNGSGSSGDPLLPVKVLRLASHTRGILTVSRTAMDLDIPLESAQAALDACVLQGSATMEPDETTGILQYRFPEFLE